MNPTTANVAMSPEAQQMLAQFMQGGQAIVKQPTQQVVTSKRGQALTPGNVIKNVASQGVLPMKIAYNEMTGKGYNKADYLEDSGIANYQRTFGGPKAEVVNTSGLQNNAPQIDWVALLAAQQQNNIKKL